MYNVIIDLEDIGRCPSKDVCFSADEVANVVFQTTGLWQLSSHIRQICPNMKVGEVKEFDDAGITIECIV